MNNTIDICQLDPTQIEYISEIAARAFADDPVFNYLIPDEPRSRDRVLTWLINKVITYGTSYGHLYTTPNLQGLAAWLPPGAFSSHPLELLQMAWQFQLYKLPAQVGCYHLRRWLNLLAATEKAHQEDMGDRPHWYLGLMVVDPTCQGQGVGSRLLQPILERARDEDLACYLVTFSPSAVRFYQKNGFVVLREQKFAIDSPPFWTLTT